MSVCGEEAVETAAECGRGGVRGLRFGDRGRVRVWGWRIGDENEWVLGWGMELRA